MYFFATLFDVNYLSRGLLLIDSLSKVLGRDFHLYILALDQETEKYFLSHKQAKVEMITLAQIETAYPELLQAKENRSGIEYYFTLSPFLPSYVLEHYSKCERITTLDADIYFYGSPAIIFQTYDEDILLTPHDFSSQNKYLLPFGEFNVSFQSFKNTDASLSFLKKWKHKCIEWCEDRLHPENGNFADQKYLDDLYKLPGVRSITLKNAGRAPWNIDDLFLMKNNSFQVQEKPLIYYHFHHLRINGSQITHGLNLYGINKISKAIKSLYAGYILQLKELNNRLSLDDAFAIRYNFSNSNGKAFSIWHKKVGAIVFFNNVIFFDLSWPHRALNYFQRKLNGRVN